MERFRCVRSSLLMIEELIQTGESRVPVAWVILSPSTPARGFSTNPNAAKRRSRGPRHDRELTSSQTVQR
jgi:hypothetical protein